MTPSELSIAGGRILDPARADFYEQRGMRTVCPTRTAIDFLVESVRACEVPQREEVKA